MARRTCFVVMPIGSQRSGDAEVSAEELRTRYDDLIKEAILKADSTLEVVRADDVSSPGTITTDILTRIMHSDIVICDVSFPNPNVFYELGLRHACRTGTVIIKDRNAPSVPFDIAHLRHIEYENSVSGLKKLADAFSSVFGQFALHPDRPDNHFLELAKIVSFRFPAYGTDDEDGEVAALTALISSPEILDMVLRQTAGEEVSQEEMIRAVASDPNVSRLMVKNLVKSGQISLKSQATQEKNARTHHNAKKRRKRR